MLAKALSIAAKVIKAVVSVATKVVSKTGTIATKVGSAAATGLVKAGLPAGVATTIGKAIPLSVELGALSGIKALGNKIQNPTIRSLVTSPLEAAVLAGFVGKGM